MIRIILYKSNDGAQRFSFPALSGKTLIAAFASGRLTSDHGVLAITCRYEDADDLDTLRADPAVVTVVDACAEIGDMAAPQKLRAPSFNLERPIDPDVVEKT